MSEVYPSDSELNDLVSDTETGVEYIPTGTAPYYLHFRKLLYRLLLAARRANDFRLYSEGGLTYGVKAGKFFDGTTLIEYPGSSGNVLADNGTFCIFLDKDCSLQYKEYDSWYAELTPEVWLAEVVTQNGEITSITDMRGAHAIAQPVRNRSEVTAHAADGDQLNHIDSGSVHTNEGATDAVRIWLPTFELAGTTYTFVVRENYELRVDPVSDILFDTSGSTAGKYKYSSTVGDTLTVMSLGDGNWVVTAKTGTWQQEV